MRTTEARATRIVECADAVIALMQDFDWTEFHIARCESGEVEIQVAARSYAPVPYVAVTFNEQERRHV